MLIEWIYILQNLIYIHVRRIFCSFIIGLSNINWLGGGRGNGEGDKLANLISSVFSSIWSKVTLNWFFVPLLMLCGTCHNSSRLLLVLGVHCSLLLVNRLEFVCGLAVDVWQVCRGIRTDPAKRWKDEKKLIRKYLILLFKKTQRTYADRNWYFDFCFGSVLLLT
jgi:hypothetical protein